MSSHYRSVLAAIVAPSLSVLVVNPPTTLNPRMSMDATGQRVGELIYRALTRIDKNLDPKPDLATSWKILDGGRSWQFEIVKDARDHSGAPITAERIAACLENYRAGKPTSLHSSAFPNWLGTEEKNGVVTIRLSKPDPYLAKNVTLLRYFTTGDPTHPCQEPKAGDSIVTSGMYRPERFKQEDLTPEYEIELKPMSEKAGRPLHIYFVLDEGTRLLKLIRGDVDVGASSMGMSKYRWIEKQYPDRFRVISNPNVAVSYLSFNLRDPILSDVRVRRAIASAIDREDFVAHKLFGFGSIAGSLLYPTLSESKQVPFKYDPALSEKLLDEAGYKRGKDGVRFKLRYKTTTVRDGFEMSRIFQSMLGKIGIQLEIEVVEPAVFLASIKKGVFQLYSSRWVGVSDGSIFHRTLRTGVKDNRVGYASSEMDTLLDQSIIESDEKKRIALLAKIQDKMMEDLPYFPLWYWSGAWAIKKGITGLEARDLSLSGSLVPLAKLR